MALWRAARRLPSWTLPALLALFLIVYPMTGAEYSMIRQVELALVLALITSGLNLSYGFAGELNLGQAAMYASGAYVAGWLSREGHTSLLLQIALAALVALVVGVITGVPGLRLGAWSLAMASFFLVLIVPDVLTLFSEQTGGHNGLVGINSATLLGRELDGPALAVVVSVVAVLWFWVMRNIVTSRHGEAFRVLKQSPVLASSMGIPVFRMKLLAYGLGSVPAGLAGALFANIDQFISPESFGFHTTTTVLTATILGGSTSVYGAALGAFIMQFGPNQSAQFQQYALLVSGAFLLIGGLVLTGGLARLGRSLVRRLDKLAGLDTSAKRPDDVHTLALMPGEELRVDGVSKAFGGNQALSDVSLIAKPGRITALIGPNGSGKTTLLNMVCGFYRTDSGVITLGDQALRTSQPHQVARAGVSRTFQTPNIQEGVTVLDAVRSGRYAAGRVGLLASILRLPSYRRAQREDISAAWRVLDLVGLSGQADVEAVSLPLGMRRLLEVARSLVRGPGVVMLDEVASGLDEDEVPRLVELLGRIRDDGGTVVLVEHNFKLVLDVADDIYVLAHGQVIAHGTPAEIASNERVRTEYLGSRASAVMEETK